MASLLSWDASPNADLTVLRRGDWPPHPICPRSCGGLHGVTIRTWTARRASAACAGAGDRYEDCDGGMTRRRSRHAVDGDRGSVRSYQSPCRGEIDEGIIARQGRNGVGTRTSRALRRRRLARDWYTRTRAAAARLRGRCLARGRDAVRDCVPVPGLA